jgi:hypothetical protein
MSNVPTIPSAEMDPEARARIARFVIERAERDVTKTVEELIYLMERLAERLTRSAADLRARGADASVNTLGEVQGQGLDVDRLCALLRERKATAQMLTWALEQPE